MHSGMLIGDIATRGAKLAGNRPAFFWEGGRQRTFFEFEDRILRTEALLTEAGITEGSRLAVLSTNCPEFLEFCFAASWLGAVVVPLNIRLNAEDLRFQIGDAGVTHALVHPGLESLARDSGLLQNRCWVIGDELDRQMAAARPRSGRRPRPLPNLPFIHLYTSGTTGRPKGCLLTQAGWLASNANLAVAIRMGYRDLLLGVYPFFHVAGFGFALTTLQMGGTVVIPGSTEPADLWDAINRYQVTLACFPGFPSVLKFAAEQKIDTSSIRGVLGGANMINLKDFDLFHELIPKATHHGIYGCTEGGNVVIMNTEAEEFERPGTIGRPLICFDYAILDEDDEVLPPGAVGELGLRGPSTMIGYWNLPEATEKVLRNGWTHTGDLMRRDEDGFLYFVDRSKDMIKTGGENVFSIEVETVLSSHPAVVDVAVIGVPDSKWGEAVKAILVLKPGSGITVKDLDTYCHERMSAFKRPRWYEFVNAIPRSVTQKLVKKDLRALHDPSKCIRLREHSK